MKVAGSSISGSQDGISTMPAPSGGTPTWGAARYGTTVIQTPRQLAVTSNSFQRKTTDYAVTVTTTTAREATLAEKPETFEIQECEYTPTIEGVREAVLKSLSQLKGIWQKNKKDPVLCCMEVATEISQLKKRFNIRTGSKDCKFVEFQLAPYYENTLRPALETIKRQVDNGCGWEYYAALGPIGKYLRLQTGEASDKDSNTELLKGLYRELIASELDYLDYMKVFPLKRTANNANTIITKLLSKKYGVQGFKFMGSKEVSQIIRKKELLIKTVKDNLLKGVADKDIDKLEEDMCRETDNKKIKLMKRRYSDMLKEIFDERKDKYRELKHVSTTNYLSFITSLSDLLVRCNSRISELYKLPHSIEEEITRATKIQLNNYLYKGVRLEEKMLKFIEDMLDKEMGNKKCGKLCLYCKELEFPLQDVTAVQTNKTTGCQLKDKLSEMVFTPGNKPEAQKAAGKLRELFLDHGHEIMAMDIKGPYMSRVIALRKSLHKELFGPLIGAFDKLENPEGLEREKAADAKRRFYPELVALIPYTFILTNEKERDDLANLACTAWYCDIEELSQKALFREEDVDRLLDLKRLSPHILDQPLRAVLERAMVNLFQFVVRDTGEISVEKIAILSQWVDDLNRVKPVDEQLGICNEQWKETNRGATRKRDRVSSDIPSTFVPMFDIDQAVSKSVTPRGKPATARIPCNQSIPDTTLSQPASEKASLP